MPLVDELPSPARRKVRRRVVVVCICLVACAIAGNAVAVMLRERSQQAALQAVLANPSSTDYAATATAATQLIQGKLDGEYHFSNDDLATYYLDGAVAYSNLKQYSKAVAYYEAAPKYDGAVQMAALEGEAYAGYAAGERSQLIPILQKLSTLSAGIHNPTTPTSAQYQDDILAIQHNQPAENL